jgi:hypothetical protein
MPQQELTQFEMLESTYDSSLVISFHTYKNEFLNWHQRAIEGIAYFSKISFGKESATRILYIIILL